MDDLYKKSFLPLLGIFGGLAWLVAGFIILICPPQVIQWAGFNFFVIGLVLLIISVCYFVNITGDENSRLIRKLNKKITG